MDQGGITMLWIIFAICVAEAQWEDCTSTDQKFDPGSLHVPVLYKQDNEPQIAYAIGV